MGTKGRDLAVRLNGWRSSYQLHTDKGITNLMRSLCQHRWYWNSEEPESSTASTADTDPSVASTEPELTESESTKSESEQVKSWVSNRYSLTRLNPPDRMLLKVNSLREGSDITTCMLVLIWLLIVNDHCIINDFNVNDLCNMLVMQYCVMYNDVITSLQCCLHVLYTVLASMDGRGWEVRGWVANS